MTFPRLVLFGDRVASLVLSFLMAVAMLRVAC